jgi:hypothetical protein
MKNDQSGTTKMAIMMAIVAIVVASIALLAVSKMQKTSVGGSPAVSDEGSAPVGSSTPGKPLGLSYTQAQDLYADGYRIQFSSCSGTPGTLNVAAGSTIMLDNRDNTAHTIKVGGTSYSLGAYGFRVVKASAKGKLQVTCDGKGAAVLNVQ